MKLLVLSGPTAAGKTALSLLLAKKLDGEIINADMGQFYSAFSVGTAKPDWQASPIPHHLFDSVTQPTDTSVVAYKKMVTDAVADCVKRGKQPILVGGSLFYIKSLFYPPLRPVMSEDLVEPVEASWEALNAIDPERASSIEKNDAYRIRRALQLFYSTGEKPSMFQPSFAPMHDSVVVFINPSREVLYHNINMRCDEMFDVGGWVEEVERCIGTDWEQFIEYKGLIGYREILAWIRNGKQKSEYLLLKEFVKQKTRQYAKRQEIFWKKFSQQIAHDSQSSDKKVEPMTVIPTSLEDMAEKVATSFIKIELP